MDPLLLPTPPRKPLDRTAWGSFAAGALALLAALVLLIATEWAVLWPAVLGAVGIGMGVVGFRRASRYHSGRGPATAGLVCGTLACLLTAIEWFAAADYGEIAWR